MYCIYRLSNPFQIPSLGFIPKIFLKSRKFQHQYFYKIHSYRKQECTVPTLVISAVKSLRFSRKSHCLPREMRRFLRLLKFGKTHFSLKRVQNSCGRCFNSSSYAHFNISSIQVCKLYIRYKFNIPRNILVVDASVLLLVVILRF